MEPVRASSERSFFHFSQAVEGRRTALHNRLVASYHKAKRERADFARELEVAKGKLFFL